MFFVVCVNLIMCLHLTIVMMVAPLTKKRAVNVAVVVENRQILQMKENDHILLVSCVVRTMELPRLVPVHYLTQWSSTSGLCITK